MSNPFEFEGANTLTTEEVIDYFIEDYNYSRFIQSTRNIFLIGERGTGKTMTLLYNAYQAQYEKAKRNDQPISFKLIGVHIPCNTPLFHKKEYQLIENDFKTFIVCEHYLVLTILSHLINTLISIPDINEAFLPYDAELRADFEYILGEKLVPAISFLSAINKFIYKESINTQRKINDLDSDAFYQNAISFSSLVIPVIDSIKRVPLLHDTHFMLMIDDAHDLNEYQVKTLNSWIAYRDHNSYSFKVAIARLNPSYSFATSSGGTILEGHDFTSMELEKAFVNKDSAFAKLAKQIVERRLRKVGITTDVESFFPTNPDFLKDLAKANVKAMEQANKKYVGGSRKQINDYVYKYGRAEYFRQRDSKANRPPYSGFDTIVNLSTGVVRNLLDPCFWMYDYVISKQGPFTKLTEISPSVQTEIIQERSTFKWEWLKQIHRYVDGCSEQQSKQINQLFDQLMVLFRQRLLKHKSEPRAIIFSISGREAVMFGAVQDLLNIVQRAQMLYTRTGNAKDDGLRETYYIPNRILLPARGLDPVGQHAHVQLKAIDLWAAAENNKPFPFANIEDQQTILFDD